MFYYIDFRYSIVAKTFGLLITKSTFILLEYFNTVSISEDMTILSKNLLFYACIMKFQIIYSH